MKLLTLGVLKQRVLKLHVPKLSLIRFRTLSLLTLRLPQLQLANASCAKAKHGTEQSIVQRSQVAQLDVQPPNVIKLQSSSRAQATFANARVATVKYAKCHRVGSFSYGLAVII